MVNPFSGDFQYNLPVLNVPGADGGGYALSLSYNGSPALHNEASWVGHNWTLNPGALNRSKKGLPDDYKGKVKEHNRIKPSWTFSRTIGRSVAIQIGKSTADIGGNISISNNITYSFSNIRGYGKSEYSGIGGGISTGQQSDVGLSAGVGIGLNFSGRDVSLNAYVSIGPALNLARDKSTGNTDEQKHKFWKQLGHSAANGNSASFSINQLSTAKVGNAVANMVKPAAVLSKTFGFTAQGLFGPVTASNSLSENIRLEVAQPEILYEAYGYMYNPSLSTHKKRQEDSIAVMSDYGVEKNSVYSPRDKVIGIPYNNADYFNAVGEGIAGGYRLHHHKVGHYYSDLTASILSKENIVIPNITGGGGYRLDETKTPPTGIVGTIGASVQVVNRGITKAAIWAPDKEMGSRKQAFEFDDTYNNTIEETDNLPFFRATGDLGGALLYADLDSTTTRGGNPIFPDPEDLSGLVKDFRGGFLGTIRKGTSVYDGEQPNKNLPNISKYISSERYVGDSSYYKGQASYMEYVRNKDLNNNNQLNVSEAFEKNARTLRFISPNSTSISNGSIGEAELAEHIAQIRVWNPDGNRYTYGLPVYVKDEADFSYGVDVTNKVATTDSLAHWGNGLNTSLIEKATFYPDVARESQLEIKLGQELQEWYANNYLMTQITTPDYVDVTQDGPSADDFGGYTSFDYRRWMRTTGNRAANRDQWYRYRTPYTGLAYQENELAKQSDDMGTVSSGLRENYYLNAIETKSHIALFITNKTVADEDFDFGFDTNNALRQAAYNGSGDDRYDGLGQLAETPSDLADPNENNSPVVASDTSALNNKDAKAASQQVEKLERIVLFAKSDLSKPLVITHFDYDYSSWTNVTNNVHARYNDNPTDAKNSGKLTLKKVWFEYQGVKNYRVSPYEFDYTYKKITGANKFDPVVQARYPHLFNNSSEGWPTYEEVAERPYFDPNAVGRWGNWAYNGTERNKNHLDWLYQGEYEAPYDPAAWMLKQIKLPSGGEIHVQYEEKTYQTVQDKQAAAMVSLKAQASFDDNRDNKNKYYLDLDDLGIEATDTNKMEALVTAIKEEHFPSGSTLVSFPTFSGGVEFIRIDTGEVKPSKRIYFKFKYNLQNNSDNSAEFISGYAAVRKVGVDVNGVYLSLGNIGNRGAYAKREGIPRQLCYDYIVGMNNQNFEFDYQNKDTAFVDYPKLEVDSSTGSASSSYDDFLDRVRYGLTNGDDLGLAEQYKKMKVSLAGKNYVPYNQACKDLHFEESYIRVPMVTPKRGGGVRVKRVLMYDAGMHSETGDAQLFGTEYHYVKEDGTCSGVASNEPQQGREENALVSHEKREEQSNYSKIIAGRDRKESELPHGEFMLPSPSVHYSRVVLSNINVENAASVVQTKRQAGGFTVQEYYTAADYPTKMYFDESKEDYGILNESASDQNIDKTGLWGDMRNGKDHNYSRKQIATIPGVISYSVDKRWLAQGFLFIQTNMVGQQRENTTYGGTYDPLYFSDHTAYLSQQNGSSDISLTSKMEYSYYQPGQTVNTLVYDAVRGFTVKKRHLGLTDDVTIVQQAVTDNQTTSSLDLGMTVSYFGGVNVTPNIGFNFTFAEKAMSRHMTTRVLYFPAVLKSVKTTMNRATSSVEHLAFSELTGSPIISKTTDGYDRTVVANYSSGTPVPLTHKGYLYNWNLPAAWYYPNMGQRALNSDNLNQLTASVGSVTTYGKKGNPLGHVGGVNAWVADTNTQKNVLAASVMTLKNNDWFATTNDPVLNNYAPNGLTTATIDELNQTYRVYQNFVYQPTTGASSANGGNNRTHSSGIMDEFTFFDWSPNAVNNNWKAVSEVTLYSPNGYALEEQDLLANIPSAAKYGYQKFLSTAVAKNARYTTIGFESFEDELFGQDTALVENAHAGRYALRVGATAKTVLSNIEVDRRVKDPTLGNGYLLRLWVKNELVNRRPVINWSDPSVLAAGLQVVLTNGTTTTSPMSSQKIAQVGEWVLLDYRFAPNSLVVATNYDLQLSHKAGKTVLVDDVRLQPVQAEMSTHVYDSRSFKLLATFGAEHFGAFYQYNDEGTLVRTLIETERGLKTIQESQSNTPMRDTIQ